MPKLREWIQLLGMLLVAGFVALPPRQAEPEPAKSPPGQTSTPIIASAGPAAVIDDGIAQCIIAIVPDPVDSDLRWMFDPQVDAIYGAALHEQYSLLTYDLPDWDPAQNDGSVPKGKAHETTPGSITFARPGGAGRGAQETLRVYLVYETATAGIHQQAMKVALDASTSAACGSAKTVRIVGPTFSGSSATLRRTLDRYRPDDASLRFSIITGGATAQSNQDLLTGERLTFNSAVRSDEEVVPKLLDFVTSRYLSHNPDVALLVESTTYGNAIAGDVARRNGRFEVMRFPLHISRLRGLEGAPTPSHGPRVDESMLPLTLGETFQPTDRLPVITAATTAPAVDLMLHGIFESIRRTRVNAVGLFATDTRDKLFLAQEIARAIPGILLFTTDTDILYTHPQYRGVARGMLVASTYPMVPAETSTAGVSSPGHSFPSSASIGTYNATLALLHDPEGRSKVDLLEYGSYASLDDTLTPPVWFSVATSTGVWPLTYAAPATGGPAYSRLVDEEIGAAPIVHASSWTWFASIVVLMMALLHLAAEVWVFGRGTAVTRGPITWVPPRDGRHLAHLRVSLFALIVIAILFFGMWFAGTEHEEQIGSWVQLAAAACAAIAFAGTLRGVPSFRRPALLLRGKMAALWLIAVVLGCVIIAATARYFYELVGAPAGVIRLFFDRASHPSSGASPVFALVAVVLPVYLWGLVHLYGANKMPHSRLFAFVARLGTGARASRWASRFDLACNRPLVASPSFAIAFVVIALGAATTVMLVNGMASAEASTFTWSVLAAWLLAQFLLSLSLVQTGVVWVRFREGLRALAAHPLSSAYTRVPSQMLGDRLSPRRPRTRDLAPLVNARAQLAAPLEPLAEGVRDTRADALAAMARLQAAPLKTFDKDVASHRDGWTRSPTFRQLVADARVVRVALKPWWEGRLCLKDKALVAWCRRAEEFLGMFVVLFVRETLARVTATLLFMVVAILLLVYAQTLFTFHPRQVLLAMTWCYAVVAITTALVVFVTVERDIVLARLASTEEGKVVWDRVFLGKVLVYALIPLATLFAAQFPQIGDMLQQWLTPVRQSLP